MNLSENLKRIRKEHNLSQEQFAEKLGVSRQSVSKWESDLAYPELDKILQISKTFHIQIDDLLNQNIQEVTKENQSKIAVNKLIDSFLSYITKSIDMFSSMKWKSKVKCILEQCLIISVLFCILLIFAAVGNYILDGFISSLPRKVYNIFMNACASFYIILAIALGTTLFLHIFKVRYLDYYEIATDNENEEDENKTEKTEENSFEKEHKEKKKIYLEKKKEKIIIRDPEGKDYKFIKGLLKMIVLFIKLMVAMIALGVSLLLIGLVVCFVVSFLIVKTGVFFMGLSITFLSSILMTLIVLAIMVNFIINRKNNKRMMLYSFFASLLVFGVGIGLTCIGFTKFHIVEDFDNVHYKTHTQTIEMDENLIIDDRFYGAFEYIEEAREDIRFEIVHATYYEMEVRKQSNFIQLHSYQEDFLSAIRSQIEDINRLEMIDYSKIRIRVYASHENLEHIHQNREKYHDNLRENELERYLKREENYKEKIAELEEENIILKDQLEEFRDR